MSSINQPVGVNRTAGPGTPNPGMRGNASEVQLDWRRAERTGLDEAVLCAGKSVGQIATIIDQVAAANASMLLTRLDSDTFASLPSDACARLTYEPLSRTAVVGEHKPTKTRGQVGIVSAGTSDLPVACEAARTLEFFGHLPVQINDVGVAGIWRLFDRLDEIKALPIVIAVAGMDAAIVSVLGGLLSNVLIALPTSTGYGAARNGETALAASLASCSPGVPVMNIDNGFGAACAAMRVLNVLRTS